MLKSFFKGLKKDIRSTKILSRHEVLSPYMVGKSFLVHNGRSYLNLEVVRLRLGFKAGSFVLTRKTPVHKTRRRK